MKTPFPLGYKGEVAILLLYFVIPFYITGVPMPPADESTLDIQQGCEVYTCMWLLILYRTWDMP